MADTDALTCFQAVYNSPTSTDRRLNAHRSDAELSLAVRWLLRRHPGSPASSPTAVIRRWC